MPFTCLKLKPAHNNTRQSFTKHKTLSLIYIFLLPHSSAAMDPANKARRTGLSAAVTTDYGSVGLSAGLTFICGTVVVGAVALATGKKGKAIYDRMFRMRMVAVVSKHNL